MKLIRSVYSMLLFNITNWFLLVSSSSDEDGEANEGDNSKSLVVSLGVLSALLFICIVIGLVCYKKRLEGILNFLIISLFATEAFAKRGRCITNINTRQSYCFTNQY